MRAVSDYITVPSPIMIGVIVGSSILSIVGIGLYAESPDVFVWNAISSDFKVLLGLFFFTIIIMICLCWMMLNLSISNRADKDLIRARIFPFMRSYRKIPFSEIERIEVISYGGGMNRYGVWDIKDNWVD